MTSNHEAFSVNQWVLQCCTFCVCEWDQRRKWNGKKKKARKARMRNFTNVWSIGTSRNIRVKLNRRLTWQGSIKSSYLLCVLIFGTVNPINLKFHFFSSSILFKFKFPSVARTSECYWIFCAIEVRSWQALIK